MTFFSDPNMALEINTLAILDIVNTIQDNMDKKLYTCGIFIDLKKAFVQSLSFAK